MIFRNRALACAGAGAVGLFAVGAFAAPALADNSADLEVKVTGTTIAADASGKFATVSLINHSKTDAKGILVTLDVSKLKTEMVELVDESCDPPKGGKILCGIEGDTIEAGADIDWAFPLVRKDKNLKGSAGTLTVTISHEGTDPNEKNNSATVEVVLSEEHGVDLAVGADDLRDAIDLDKSTKSPAFSGELIHPGDAGALVVYVLNQGDRTAKGLKVSATLPKQVTFAEVEPGCVYTADNRGITCDYAAAELVPAEQDKSDDLASAGAAFWFPVKVSQDVTGPVTLTGGTATVVALDEVEVPPGFAALNKKPAELPANVELLDASRFKDVDLSDNTDEFSVFVAGNGGGGGGLPVTGAQAGLIGGIGLAVVVAGGALFMVSRRRRVVLVAPGDEKPTV